MMLDDAVKEMLNESVKRIAVGRRSIEITGEDVEEFDTYLNELCESWHDRLKDMDELDLTFFMLKDLLDRKGESDA